MSRLNTSFVLGYHGCERRVGKEAVRGKLELLHSDRDFDWLGPGIYFWESDPVRAKEWATAKAQRGDFKKPFVIGAVIDLRHCLDLTVREDLELLRFAYEGFRRTQEKAGLKLPVNKSTKKDENSDRLLRYLDNAVIRHLHNYIRRQPKKGYPELGFRVEPFDTVRGMFVEGERLFKGSGIRRKTHTQIAVLNRASIKGLFFAERC